MIEPFDPLEAELQSLRPLELSSTARERIAIELEAGVQDSTRTRLSRVWWSGAATGGLVAACLAAGLLLLPALHNQPESDPPLAPAQIPVAAAFDDTLPTIWAYRRALARSPHELEVLLDKHARLAAPRGGPEPVHLFILSDAERLLHGDL